jgi:hypothetical protein
MYLQYHPLKTAQSTFSKSGSVFYSRKLNKKEDVRLRGTSGGWEHGDLRMVWGILMMEGERE